MIIKDELLDIIHAEGVQGTLIIRTDSFGRSMGPTWY
jgi:hypothetical protein